MAVKTKDIYDALDRALDKEYGPYRTTAPEVEKPMRKKIRLWWIRVIFRIIRLITLHKRPKKKIPYAVYSNDIWKVYHKKGIFYFNCNEKKPDWHSASGRYIDSSLTIELSNIANSANCERMMKVKNNDAK